MPVQTAAQSVILQDLLTGRRLLVANTHLYWHANANHIRLIQLYMLLRVLAKEAARVSHGAPVAVLLFGAAWVNEGAAGNPLQPDEEYDPEAGPATDEELTLLCIDEAHLLSEPPSNESREIFLRDMPIEDADFSVSRFAKHQRALNELTATQQSMLDRLHDRAAALGGKCLAIGYKNNHTKVPWQCQHGHTWDARPSNVLNQKQWCPECARNRRRIPLQRLQDHAKTRGSRCLSTSKYNSSKTKVFWQCKLGHTWEATPDRVLYGGTWCPKCSRKGRTYKRRSLNDLQEHAACLGGRCLATTYEGMLAPVFWQCHRGHIWRARPDAVLSKRKVWCPVCAGNAPLDLQRLQEHAACRGGKCLAKKYANMRSKVTWECEHGHTWQARPHNVLNLGQWCPHCRKIGLPRLRAHAAALGGRCLAKSYKNASKKLLWECSEGHRWKASAHGVLNGKTWCPECAAATWRTEAEIRSILETLFHPAVFPSCFPSFLEGLQLDGFAPDLRLAFEYQGEQHYDPENYFHFGDTASFHAQQRRDARKVELCKDAGVRLLIIPCFVNDKRTFVLTSLLQWFSWSQITPLELPGWRIEIQLQLPAPWVGDIQMLRQRDEKIGLQLEKLLQKVGPKLKKEATGMLVDDAGDQLPGFVMAV
ncbi:hypothetical protein AK812_SmicGene12147 [Symbiodinium microadriaticum]|uniref:Treble clef zinc finger domain-containing protein n=1 Tax=Symbiodinium microadriaticum TaxID=2951 RepID=A0A1Q9EBB9_SYMMI|nr:hypothetical protein AK812_SmicGene12147 [Symbiodinium microadriaticum]